MKTKRTVKTKAAPTTLKEKLQSKSQRRKKDKVNTSKKYGKITSAFRIFRDSLSLTRQYWKLFAGIIGVYFLLSIFLVGGLGNSFDINELRQSMGAELGEAATTVALFGLLLGSAASTESEAGTAYLSIVIIIVSLATIWALRQILGGEKITAKQAFYKGMTPLVPFALVLVVLALTLLPILLAGFLFSTIFGNGLAVSAIEIIAWSIVILGLIILSIRLFTTFMFALYIVTLPDMKPLTALRSARQFVRFRRLMVIRKVLFLPFVYVLISALIFLPLIALIPVIVQPLFIVVSLYAFIFAHVYFYSLYKEML